MATKIIKAWIDGAIQEIEVEDIVSPEQPLSVEDRLIELEDKPIITDGNLLVGNGTDEPEEMTPDEVLAHINGASVTTLTSEEYEALTPEETNANTLYMITDAEEEVSGKVVYVTVTDNGDGTYAADKTYDELVQAYNDGCALFCKHNTFVAPLVYVVGGALWFATVANSGNAQSVIQFHHDGWVDVYHDSPIATQVQIITWEDDD